MLTACEHRLIVRYLANLASCLHHRDREAQELVAWVVSNGRRRVFGGRKMASRAFGGKRRRSRALPLNLGRKRLGLDDLLAPEDFKDIEDCADGPTGKQWSRLGEALRSKGSEAKSLRSDRTAQRLRCLGRTAGLSRTDVAILELMLRYQTQPIIESMIDSVLRRSSFGSNPFNLTGPALPALLGVSANAILGRLRADAPLVRSGLVCIDSDDGDLTLVNRLHRLATIPGGPELDMNRLLLGETSPSELEWPDFDHLGRDRDHVEKLLGGALDAGAPGVNVLVYGPPGTGKTEFCKVLAGRLGVDLHRVGESDEDGDEPTRHERLQELRLAQRLIARGRRSPPCCAPNATPSRTARGRSAFGRRGNRFPGRMAPTRSRAPGSPVMLPRFAERSFGTFQEQPVKVVLPFDARAARDAAAFRFHPSQSIEENEDGSLTVRFEADGLDEMCWHLFTWGESVTVEKPARLRRRLAAMCASLAAQH